MVRGRARIAYALITHLLVVNAIDTKYFKRFYFGNLSVDLTDQLGERFNYDYLPPRSSAASEHHGHGKNPHHRVLYNDPPPHHHEPAPDPSQQKPEQQEFQGDQPAPNGTTAPPPVTSNQPYRHQDLKALSRNITSILNSFNVSYDKRVRPNYGGDAVEVGITMFVLSISDLSEVEMDFTLDFYFRQMWKDNRLTFEGPTGVKQLSVSSEFLKSMWVPDTFFVNEKTSYFHTATTNNEFLRISEKGDILRSMRLTVCASCPMDLRHFPMDSQLCNIEIESFGYTMSDIRYKWNAGAGSVGMANDVSLPQFKVFGYRQKTYEISLSTGNYSRLACEIQFVRSMGYYLIQIYIPSSLIVVISWVSFWLNRNAAPARVYLGITTVLTMTTLMSSTNKALPKISYVKSIDVYLGTCFVMVFAALLEYATVGYLAKRIQMRKNHFAALQKMALQLQTARDEHVQKTYAPPTPVTPAPLPPAPMQQVQQQQQQPPPPLQMPTNPNTPHHSNPHTPHTPRYERSYEGSSTLRKYTTNNAQLMNNMGSQVSIPYAHAPQPRSAYDPATRSYYDAGYDRSQYYAQQQPTSQQQYYNRDSWGGGGGGGDVQGGSSSRHASVKRRNHDDHHAAYAHQQNIINPPQMYAPNTHVVVGSVIGTTSIEQAPPHQQMHHQVAHLNAPVVVQQQQQHQAPAVQPPPQPQQPPVGDRIRQLIPINPNQICGITPSDIDKYSRVVFPVCFVCFNLLYWIIYLHISNVNPTPDLVIMNQEG